MVVVTKLSTVVGDVDVPPGKGDVPPVTELLGDGDSPAVEELLGIADVATGDDEFPGAGVLGVGDVPIAAEELLGNDKFPSAGVLGVGDVPIAAGVLGDGDFPAVAELLGDGDGDIAAEDGVLTVGEGLFKVVQLLSAVVEPALLSVSVLLHIVQFVHETEFIAVENVPNGQLVHIRSDVLVPLIAII